MPVGPVKEVYVNPTRREHNADGTPLKILIIPIQIFASVEYPICPFTAPAIKYVPFHTREFIPFTFAAPNNVTAEAELVHDIPSFE